MISYGVMFSSLHGTWLISISNPQLLFEAASIAALVSPAAPKSCIPSRQFVEAASRQASINIFSKNGFPTCTEDLCSWSPSKDWDASPDAPCIPSLPVSAPTKIIEFPGFPADALSKSSCFNNHTHIALTNGFESYESSKIVSPPTFGIPIQFPYPEIPETTPSNKYWF